jgi:hypothetical protein
MQSTKGKVQKAKGKSREGPSLADRTFCTLHFALCILHCFRTLSRPGRGGAVRNDLAFVADLANRLEHLLWCDLGLIVTNVQQVFFQIDGDLLDARKP